MKKGFPPHFRLRSKADFSSLRQGRKLVSGGLQLIYRVNDMGHARLGMAVSRRYGNAVHRNRLKRQVRECFRLSGIHDMSVDVLVAPLYDWKQMKDPEQDICLGLNQIIKCIRKGQK